MDTEHLKRCDILLAGGSGLTSRLITWKTKSPYSHVAVVVEPEIFLGIEANTGHQAGVRAFDLRIFKGGTTGVFRVKPEFGFDAGKVIFFLVAHLGAGYDWTGVVWLGTLKLFGFKAQANRFQKDKDYFCSELVYEAFAEAGLDIVPEVSEADTVSPADISRSSVLAAVP